MITPDHARAYTGLKKEALDLDTDEALDAQLLEWIEQASGIVTDFCNQTWETGQEPPAARNAVQAIVANMVAQARIRRQTSILDVNEYRQTLVPDEVFTKTVKRSLMPHRKLSPLRSSR